MEQEELRPLTTEILWHHTGRYHHFYEYHWTTEQYASIMISAKGSISIISEKGEKLPINSMERVLTRQNGVFFFVLIQIPKRDIGQ